MTEKEDPNFVERFTVRMPDGMRDAIAERAKANGRSMNSEIIEIITNAMFMSSFDGSAVNYILEMAKSDEFENLQQEEKSEAEAILFELATNLTHRIDKETAHLREVLEVLASSKDKKPT